MFVSLSIAPVHQVNKKGTFHTELYQHEQKTFSLICYCDCIGQPIPIWAEYSNNPVYDNPGYVGQRIPTQ